MSLKGFTVLSLKGQGDSRQPATTAEREMQHTYSKKSKRIMLGSADQSASLGCKIKQILLEHISGHMKN